MACVVLADALCGTFVAVLNLFPVVGGCVPVVTESIENNIFGLCFCPFMLKYCGVSAKTIFKAGRGRNHFIFRRSDRNSDIGASLAVAYALCVHLVAVIVFDPSISGFAPVVTECFQREVFGLSFSPICIELSGVSSFAVCKAGSGGDFRIGDGRFIGFHMACVMLADALCGAFIAALNLFPVVGGSVPAVIELRDSLVFGLCFKVSKCKHRRVSAKTFPFAGGLCDYFVGGTGACRFKMRFVALAIVHSVAGVAAVCFFAPADGRSVPIVADSGQVYTLSGASVYGEYLQKLRVREVRNIFSSSGGGTARLFFNTVNALYPFALNLVVGVAGTACDAVFALPPDVDRTPIVNDFRNGFILFLFGECSVGKDCGVSAKAFIFLRCGGDYRIGRGDGFRFRMISVFFADALRGTFIAAGDFFPVVGGSVPVVFCFRNRLFLGLSFRPSRLELRRIFAETVFVAGCGGDFHISCGDGFRFRMIFVIFADALCGTFVAAVLRRPFVGGSVPIVFCFRNRLILGLSFRPSRLELRRISAETLFVTGCGGDYIIPDGGDVQFYRSRIGFVAAGRFAVVTGRGFIPKIFRLVPFGGFRPLRVEEEAGTAVSRYIGSDFGNRPFGESGILVPAVEVIAVSCGNGKNGFRSENMGFGCSLGKRSA